MRYDKDIYHSVFSLILEINRKKLSKDDPIKRELDETSIRVKRGGKILQIPLRIHVYEWKIRSLKRSIIALKKNYDEMPSDAPSDVCIDVSRYISQHEELLYELKSKVNEYYE